MNIPIIIIVICLLCYIGFLYNKRSIKKTIKQVLDEENKYGFVTKQSSVAEKTQLGYQMLSHPMLDELTLTNKKKRIYIERELQWSFGTMLDKLKIFFRTIVSIVSSVVVFFIAAVMIAIFIEDKEEADHEEINEPQQAVSKVESKSANVEKTSNNQQVAENTSMKFYADGEMVYERADYSTLDFPLAQDYVENQLFKMGFIPNNYGIMYEGEDGPYYVFRVFEDMDTHVVTYDFLNVDVNTGRVTSQYGRNYSDVGANEVAQKDYEQGFYYNNYGAMLFDHDEYSQLSFPLTSEVAYERIISQGFIPPGYTIQYVGTEGGEFIYKIHVINDTEDVYDYFIVNPTTGEVFSEYMTFS